jgi:predicted short-subunit dehydrogenase-like oxidoreductase (DUF2520 family)
VRATSYREASRYANTLRAGYPVHSYAELQPSRVILVCSSDRKLHALVTELEAADLMWERKIVLVSTNHYHVGILRGFAAKGAAVGYLLPFGGPHQIRFFLEGERQALRAAKQLVEESGGQILEVRPGYSSVCEAGVTLATSLLLSAMHSAAQCLRLAGLSSRDAAATVGDLAQMSVRKYLKAGLRACRLPRSPEERVAFRQRVDSLQRFDPKLGAFFSDLGKLAVESQGGDASWLEEPLLRVYHASARGV